MGVNFQFLSLFPRPAERDETATEAPLNTSRFRHAQQDEEIRFCRDTDRVPFGRMSKTLELPKF